MPPPLPPRQGPGGRGARDRVLQAAETLFRSHGINATGVAELAAAAKVSKRTLYHHFPSKDDVVLATLQAAEEGETAGTEAVLSRTDLNARARLLELFVYDRVDHPLRGCPFINAAVEFPDPAHPVHAFAAAHKQRFAERLADTAREAGARDPDHVGQRLALLYDGASAGAVVSDNAEVAQLAFALAASVLHQAID